MRSLIKSLAFGIFLGLLGFGVVLLGTVISMHVPGLPVAASKKILTLATIGKGNTVPDWLAAQVLSEGDWYINAVLPGLAGIVEGLLVGLFRRLSVIDVALTGVSFALLEAPGSTPAFLGPFLFLFCFAGALHMTADLRFRRASLTGPGVASKPSG
jgi:hypothetical protein